MLSYVTYLVPEDCCYFFFNDTATTEIYTLSLHDALPISSSSRRSPSRVFHPCTRSDASGSDETLARADRKSTRLNSSHGYISYAVFCLKKKNSTIQKTRHDIAKPNQSKATTSVSTSTT